MKQRESRKNVIPETCAELDSVSGVLRNKLSGISLLQSIGEIADKISVSLRFFGDDGRGNLNIFVF